MSLSVDVAGGVEVDTIPMIRIESLHFCLFTLTSLGSGLGRDDIFVENVLLLLDLTLRCHKSVRDS
jgi:hypothetical protein